MTNFEMVREFRKAFGAPSGAMPAIISDDRCDLRIDLIDEELYGLHELAQSMREKDIIGIADGLADLLYVVYGAADEYGIDIDEVFKEVHRSNMSKLDENRMPTFREDGKTLKGPNYSPPDIKAVLDRQFLRD